MRKRQRRLDGVDQIVLSLSARGLTTGEIAAHFDEVYGATVSKDTISQIRDKVLEEMIDWSHRPLDRVYPVLRRDTVTSSTWWMMWVTRPSRAVGALSLRVRREYGGRI